MAANADLKTSVADRQGVIRTLRWGTSTSGSEMPSREIGRDLELMLEEN